MKKAYEKLWADVVEFEREVVMSDETIYKSFTGDTGNEDLGDI